MKKILKETKKQIDELKDLTEKEKKELFEGLKEIEKLDEDELEKTISGKKKLSHYYGIDTVNWSEILGSEKNFKTKEIFKKLSKAEEQFNKK